MIFSIKGVAKILRVVLIFIVGGVYLVVYSQGVLALTDDQIKAFQSNVHYFNTEADAIPCKAGSTLLTGSDNPTKVWNYFTGKGLSAIQTAGIMGNLQQESGFNPMIIQGGGESQDPNAAGGGGWGIVQWTPGSKVIGIAQSFGISGPIYELATQLDIVWAEMGATTPAGYSNFISAYKQIDDLAEATSFFTTNYEAAGVVGPRLEFAQDALTQFGSTTGSTSSGASAAGCATGDGVVSGNILKTAMGLAWPDSGHGNYCAAATPAYIAAHDPIYGSNEITNCTGCDVFLSTVMHSSGVDPNYPLFQTSLQLQYVKEHPEKYQILGETTGDSLDPKIQPGDILINGDVATGHTLVFIGQQPSGFNMVDGSNGQHVPQSNFWGGGGWVGTYSIVRVLN